MGIFDWLFGKNETNPKPKKETTSKPKKGTTSKSKKKITSNSNKRVWNRDLHVTKPGNMSLLVSVELQKVEFWNYFLDNKPFNGVVYYIHNEQEIFNSLNLSDLLSTSEKEKQKLIDYEFDIKDGVKNGKCRMFDKHQILRAEYEIKNDIKNGLEKEYNEYGNVTYEQLYKDDLRNGLEITYYNNGKIESQKEWVNGKCTGKFKFFDENGTLRTESTYQNGEHIGPQTCWNEKGEEVDCSLTPFQIKGRKMISTEELKLKQLEKEENHQKELDIKKSDLLKNKEKDYKKVQDVIDVDVSRLKFYNLYDVGNWYENVFKNHKDFNYFLIFTDYHSNGGCLQFEKSDTNTNSKVISEFKDEYDPTCNLAEEDFDETNDVYENDKGFSSFQIFQVKSDKFPELLKKKIDEFIQENEDDEMIGFFEWLDPELEFVNYESCEILIDSLGLNRDKDLEFVFEKQLNIVRNYGSSFDLTTNPLVISYGGYYQCGEHELFLGVIKN